MPPPPVNSKGSHFFHKNVITEKDREILSMLIRKSGTVRMEQRWQSGIARSSSKEVSVTERVLNCDGVLICDGGRGRLCVSESSLV